MEGLSREVSRHETQFVAPKATYEISVGHRPPRLDGTVDGARARHARTLYGLLYIYTSWSRDWRFTCVTVRGISSSPADFFMGI